jgi:hypothetical protein
MDNTAERGVHATMPGIGKVAACAMQLHMQAPGGQQSACDAEGAAGASCVAVAVASWHGAAACCVLVAKSLKAMRTFANAVVVPFANRARHRSRRSRYGNGRMAKE